MSVTTHSQASGLQGDLSPEPVGLLYSALVKNKLKEIKTLRRKKLCPNIARSPKCCVSTVAGLAASILFLVWRGGGGKQHSDFVCMSSNQSQWSWVLLKPGCSNSVCPKYLGCT